MDCPNESFLSSFARDPDAALDDLPGFEEHLSECDACREAIDRVACDLHGESPLDMVFGSEAAASGSEFVQIPGYRLLESISAVGSGIV